MAKRPKLSKNQRRQVQKNRVKKLKQDPLLPESNDEPTSKGRVISRYGKHAIVEDWVDKSQHPCFIRRTIDSVVCGDIVQYRRQATEGTEQRAVVEVVEDRKTVLSRPDYYDGVKPIAANIDQIIIVSSVLPEFSTHIIDRYLVACEDAQITPVILVNKIELADEEAFEYIEESLGLYQSLGYQTIMSSCKQQLGLDELALVLADKLSAFVGQSGVGKSSLINSLLPEANETVGEVSLNSGLGQHTTTTAKLMYFSQGGELIDSPGVREFGLWHLEAEKIAEGFIEFRQYLGGCKFSDCKHRNDPGCLITQAVAEGNIDEDRYHSYLKIMDTLDSQRPAYAKN